MQQRDEPTRDVLELNRLAWNLPHHPVRSSLRNPTSVFREVRARTSTRLGQGPRSQKSSPRSGQVTV
jgi:hypothetical protein